MPRGIDLLPAVLPEATPDTQVWSPPSGGAGTGQPNIVIVYNDDWHTFDDVINQLRKATACTVEKAEALANQIHTRGRAVVYGGSPEECEQVANILRQIRLQVETDRG